MTSPRPSFGEQLVDAVSSPQLAAESPSAYRSTTAWPAIAIPVGAFADPAFPPPRFSVWETRKHSWVTISGDEVEHSE